MNILNYNSIGEESIKIFIKKKNNTNLIFNNSSNYNNITLNLNKVITKSSENNIFFISLNNVQIPISWPLISEYIGNN